MTFIASFIKVLQHGILHDILNSFKSVTGFCHSLLTKQVIFLFILFFFFFQKWMHSMLCSVCQTSPSEKVKAEYCFGGRPPSTAASARNTLSWFPVHTICVSFMCGLRPKIIIEMWMPRYWLKCASEPVILLPCFFFFYYQHDSQIHNIHNQGK